MRLGRSSRSSISAASAALASPAPGAHASGARHTRAPAGPARHHRFHLVSTSSVHCLHRRKERSGRKWHRARSCSDNARLARETTVEKKPESRQVRARLAGHTAGFPTSSLPPDQNIITAPSPRLRRTPPTALRPPSN